GRQVDQMRGQQAGPDDIDLEDVNVRRLRRHHLQVERDPVGLRVRRRDELHLVAGSLRPGLGAALAEFVLLAEGAAGDGGGRRGGWRAREAAGDGQSGQESSHRHSPSESNRSGANPWPSTRGRRPRSLLPTADRHAAHLFLIAGRTKGLFWGSGTVVKPPFTVPRDDCRRRTKPETTT